jgi:single-strand DNA-binding protein
MTLLNRVVLTGKVVTQPRLYYRPDGSPVIQFPLELIDTNGREGQTLNHGGMEVKGRNRITVVASGKLAEIKVDRLQRGQHLMVIGKLHQRCWQTPEGRNRISTEVIATNLRTIEEKNPTQKLKK